MSSDLPNQDEDTKGNEYGYAGTLDDWSRDELLAALEWQHAFGVDEAIGPTALDSYSFALTHQNTPRPMISAQTPGASDSQTSNTAAVAPATKPPTTAGRALQSFQRTLTEADQLARSATSIPELAEALGKFEGCSLQKTAISTVFEAKAVPARLMIVLGAPRAEEDREGTTVAGQNRTLLTNMLKSIGLSLEDVYLTSSVFWRPPGDKKPTANDLACCKPFIEKQIELIQPEILLVMGETALRSLIDPDASLLRQRGKWGTYSLSGMSAIKSLATFAPHMLLNTPRQKALAWHDLRLVKAALSSEKPH
ncbi:uracil-DNA glycosylase [Kiloniella laminariae]|uniref:Type-4 uracil-DNA glycosylase n=1 Tax=Kiloniella laminariae TaxID=454162 RepID=A0ABT4LL33_9PROT|nr:uracil-DNA glycosylase [Kiloniella laminariae]MCZ4281816.1 uracil-DNA glycosylase [Kiloniella laminariae]